MYAKLVPTSIKLQCPMLMRKQAKYQAEFLHFAFIRILQFFMSHFAIMPDLTQLQTRINPVFLIF